jgi:hypothetical protein
MPNSLFKNREFGFFSLRAQKMLLRRTKEARKNRKACRFHVSRSGAAAFRRLSFMLQSSMMEFLFGNKGRSA